jgi:hypothetical protein
MRRGGGTHRRGRQRRDGCGNERTSSPGGFTFKVHQEIRVELALLDGEVLVKQPGVINVNRSDVDAHADFVIGTSRIARPRFAAPRFDNGLGPPIA